MALPVRWSDRARAEFYDAIAYIAASSPQAAERVQQRIEAAVARLTAQPSMGRPGRVNGTRELIVGGTDDIVPYRVRAGEIVLLALIHARRRWPDDFDDAPV